MILILFQQFDNYFLGLVLIKMHVRPQVIYFELGRGVTDPKLSETVNQIKRQLLRMVLILEYDRL
jgi:hypothetical protein